MTLASDLAGAFEELELTVPVLFGDVVGPRVLRSRRHGPQGGRCSLRAREGHPLSAARTPFQGSSLMQKSLLGLWGEPQLSVERSTW
jgi:hypothetical protein